MHRLEGDCDFDLQPSDMAFACNTLPCHHNYLCQIILKKVMGQIRTCFTDAYAQT